MEGQDVMGIAEPGSGKTLGYLLPTVAHLQQLGHGVSSQPVGPVALVLVPTRELALQVTAVCKTFHKELGLRAQAIIGGVDKTQQVIEQQLERCRCRLCLARKLLDIWLFADSCLDQTVQ